MNDQSAFSALDCASIFCESPHHVTSHPHLFGGITGIRHRSRGLIHCRQTQQVIILLANSLEAQNRLL